MAALTGDRANVISSGLTARERPGLAAGGVLIHKGALIARNAAGFMVPGASGPGLITVGIAQERVDNRLGGDGAARCLYITAVAVRMKNDLTRPVTQAHLHVGTCDITDDQTVQAPGRAGGVFAGIPEKFERDGEVLVYVAAELSALVAARTPSA